MSVPDVKITPSRLSRMSAERRGFLLEYLDRAEVVDHRVSEITRTITLRWAGRGVAPMLVDTLHQAVLEDCGPKARFSPATGEFTLRGVAPLPPVRCPVKGCKCKGSNRLHRALVRG